MRIVQAIHEAQALDSVGRLSYQLIPQQQYVMLDHEAEAGVRDGALENLRSLDEVLPPYQGQPLEDHKILVPFTGGQGDSLLLMACLQALKNEYPNCTIDISCPRIHHRIFAAVR